jgi:hypothetical protein
MRHRRLQLGDARRRLPVTEVDLDAAYRANEVRADALYLHKIVHVTGIVDKIAKDLANRAVTRARSRIARHAPRQRQRQRLPVSRRHARRLPRRCGPRPAMRGLG